jgi:GR25 family glycosyltransferase involved in LPS biosynthesis
MSIHSTFVINLKRRSDRLESFKKRWNLPVNAVEAVDCNEHTFNSSSKLRNAERCCFESHMKVWKLIADSDANDDDLFLIFEDDADFIFEDFNNPKHFNIQGILKAFRSRPALCYLGGRFNQYFNFVNKSLHFKCVDNIYQHRTDAHKYHHLYPYAFDRCLECYIVNKSCVKKLLDLLNNDSFNMAVDTWINHLTTEIYKFDLFPHLTFQNKNIGYDSDIQYLRD